MKVLIADDEAPARQRLRRLVGELLPEAELSEAADGDQAWALSEQSLPDIALLDIRMPGLSGLQLAERFAALPTPPAVILVTAYDEHALEAFRANAKDYLLKPVDREDLGAAIERARQLNRVQRDSGQSAVRNRLQVSLGGRTVLLDLDQILAFIAEHKYVVAHHTEGEALIDDTLKGLEEEFPNQLLRVHRNALVARQHISGLNRRGDGRCEILLRDDERRFEVSRRHLPAVRAWLKQVGQRA